MLILGFANKRVKVEKIKVLPLGGGGISKLSPSLSKVSHRQVISKLALGCYINRLLKVCDLLTRPGLGNDRT